MGYVPRMVTAIRISSVNFIETTMEIQKSESDWSRKIILSNGHHKLQFNYYATEKEQYILDLEYFEELLGLKA